MTQKLKRSADPPPFKGGPWADIAQKREQRLQEEAARGVPEAVEELAARDQPEKLTVTSKPAKSRRKPGPAKGSPRQGGARPTYNKQQVIHMYVDKKMRILEIAKELGAHRSTVHRILGPEGANVLPEFGEKGGPRPKDGCTYGHKWLSEDDTYPGSNGGRGCRHCKRERDRQYYRDKRDKASAA